MGSLRALSTGHLLSATPQSEAALAGSIASFATAQCVFSQPAAPNATPLSPEQSLKPLPVTAWQRLNARVPDDQETLWWLFGLGESVYLHQPKRWVDVIKEKLTKMSGLYAEKPLRETMKDIARTSHRAGVEGAKYGAAIGGVI